MLTPWKATGRALMGAGGEVVVACSVWRVLHSAQLCVGLGSRQGEAGHRQACPSHAHSTVCSAFSFLRACPEIKAAVHVAVGDCIGALIAIAGVAVAFFFPR